MGKVLSSGAGLISRSRDQTPQWLTSPRSYFMLKMLHDLTGSMLGFVLYFWGMGFRVCIYIYIDIWKEDPCFLLGQCGLS